MDHIAEHIARVCQDVLLERQVSRTGSQTGNGRRVLPRAPAPEFGTHGFAALGAAETVGDAEAGAGDDAPADDELDEDLADELSLPAPGAGLAAEEESDGDADSPEPPAGEAGGFAEE
jgi:hypothetical protein